MAINFNDTNIATAVEEADVVETVEPAETGTEPQSQSSYDEGHIGRNRSRMSRDEYADYDEQRRNAGSIYDGVTSVNAFLSGPLSLSRVGQKLETMAKEMRNIIDEASQSGKLDPTSKLGVFTLSGDAGKSVWNALVMTNAKVQAGRIQYVSFAVLLFEGEQPLAPRIIKTNNDAYELPFTAFDLYSEDYHVAIKNEIHRNVCQGDTSVQLVYSGTSLLPVEFEIEDEVDLRKLVIALSNQSVSAVIDETLAIDSSSANIGDLIRVKGYEMVGQLTYTNQSSIIGVDKMPIHTDVVISTQATDGGNDGNRYPTRQSQQPVVEVGIMADLVQIVDDTPRNQRGFGRRYDSPSHINYAGNAIITHVSNGYNMVTFATALMAIATSIVTASPDVFYELLKPKVNSSKPAMGDIGAIGYQNPDDEGRTGYIDVRSDQYTRDGSKLYYEMLNDCVAENIAISIDIPENILGPRAIKNFTTVADITADRRNVLLRLGGTLNDLTGGLFATYMPTLGNVLTDDPVLIPMGYFIDANGSKRDLRELNFLAALDYAGRHNKVESFMTKWNDSMEMPNRMVGAAIRLELMREMTGGQVFVKGFARRHTFYGEFIEALAQTTMDAGLAPTITNLYGREPRTRRMLASQFNNYAVNHDRANAYNNSARFRRNAGYNQGPARRRSRFDDY